VEKFRPNKNRKWQKQKIPPLEHDKIKKGWNFINSYKLIKS